MGGGKTPRPGDNVPNPTIQDKAVQEAAAVAALRRKNASGYRSTILGSMAYSPAGPGGTPSSGGGTGAPFKTQLGSMSSLGS